MGIDLHQPSLELARRRSPTEAIDYRRADLLTVPIGVDTFDVITSVATLHHMDAELALTRMRELLRPGGTLIVVGLARSRFPADLPLEIGAVAANRFYSMRRTFWEHPSPVAWPPPDSYRQVRRRAKRLLPGSQYRRHLLWRYSITWVKPTLR